MRAIILAAGQGTRMFPLTKDVPKSLLPVGRSTILGQLMSQLQTAGVDDITVVVGHEKELVSAEATHVSAGRATILENDRYLQDVNILSLSLALAQDASPFYLFEADCLFENRCFAEILDPRYEHDSVWYSCGDFRPGQYGGVIGADAEGRVQDVDIIGGYEERYKGYKKMLGVLKVGGNEVGLYTEFLLQASQKDTKQYYHMPWIANQGLLESRLHDLGHLKADSVNTIEEYNQAREIFAYEVDQG